MVKEIFINLPIRDLQKTTDFFTKLGFAFNAKFTNEKAACMIINENIFAMLLTEPMFQSFIKKDISDAFTKTEVLLALSLGNREEVDVMMQKALDAGGKQGNDTQDHGWMYSRSFEDLDGHIWEVFTMDESKMPKE